MWRKRLEDEKIGYTSGHKKAARYKAYRTALGDQPDRWSCDQYSILFHKGGVRITRTPTLAFAKYGKQPMSEQVALVPTEIRTVEFYGDEITGALVQVTDEPEVYVPLRPLCDFMGLSWSGQRERTLRDEVLKDAVRGVRVTRTPGLGGGTQELLCLPLKLLPGWLFGISADRIKDEAIRAKIIQYRRECYDVLWNAFKNAIIAQTTTTLAPTQSGAALAYETAMAVATLAREQMELEQRMNNAAQWAKGIDTRVSALELRLLPSTQVSTSQAGELALHVKAVANALEQRGHERGYQRVYGEMYRRFSIESYKSLPQSRFDEALQWLRNWYDEIVAGGTA